jgi:drug/metabolite transporter (DMT)-like permease
MIGQFLMVGISFVGFATVATNLNFLFKKKPGPLDWQLEHIKALVGAGISVYTAFLAFGAVRFMPSIALSPILWAIPLVTGVSIIIYQQQKVKRRLKKPVRQTFADAGPSA